MDFSTIFNSRVLLPYTNPATPGTGGEDALPALGMPPMRPPISLPEGPDPTLNGQGGYVSDAIDQVAAQAQGLPAPSSGGGSSMEAKLAQALQILLPVLAGSAAFRQGALGSFTGGYLNAKEDQRRAANDEADNAYRQEVLADNRAAREYARQQDENERQARAAEAAAAKEQAITASVEKALAPYRESPMYAEGIQPDIAASTQIMVPGIGPISLQQALERVGVAKTKEGRYIVNGKTAAKEPKKATRGYTTTDADGTIYRIIEDAETGKEISRTRIGAQPRTPKEPKAPAAPKAPSVTVALDPVTAEASVKFVDPESGVTETFSEEDVAAMLDAAGYESDKATVRRAMRNPKAMQELIK